MYGSRAVSAHCAEMSSDIEGASPRSSEHSSEGSMSDTDGSEESFLTTLTHTDNKLYLSSLASSALPTGAVEDGNHTGCQQSSEKVQATETAPNSEVKGTKVPHSSVYSNSQGDSVPSSVSSFFECPTSPTMSSTAHECMLDVPHLRSVNDREPAKSLLINSIVDSTRSPHRTRRVALSELTLSDDFEAPHERQRSHIAKRSRSEWEYSRYGSELSRSQPDSCTSLSGLAEAEYQANNKTVSSSQATSGDTQLFTSLSARLEDLQISGKLLLRNISRPQNPQGQAQRKSVDPARHRERMQHSMRRVRTESSLRPHPRGEKDGSLKPSEWGSIFWCAVRVDEGDDFYVNPQTGQCNWSIPEGAFVVPAESSGQWWELFDRSTMSFYYYQTETKETQWDHPGTQRVVPMYAVQKSMLDSYSSPLKKCERLSSREAENERGLLADSAKDIADERRKDRLRGQEAQQRPHAVNSEIRAHGADISPKSPQKTQSINLQPRQSSLLGEAKQAVEPVAVGNDCCAKLIRTKSGPRSVRQTKSISSIATSAALEPLPSSEKIPLQRMSVLPEFDLLIPPVPPVQAKVLKSARIPTPTVSAETLPYESAEWRKPYRRERDPVKRKRRGLRPREEDELRYVQHEPQVSVIDALDLSPYRTLPKIASDRPQASHVSSSSRTVADDPGATFDEYAKGHFAVHRHGLTRRKVSIEQLISWQGNAATAPLHHFKDQALRRDALSTFKIIMRVFGDRQSAVFDSHFVASSVSHMRMKGTRSSRRSIIGSKSPSNIAYMQRSRFGALDQIRSWRKQQARPFSETLDNRGSSVIQEVKWLLERAMTSQGLHDEIFAQMMKQLNGTPSAAAVQRGWAFFAILLTFLAPSERLRPYVECFIENRRKYLEQLTDQAAGGFRGPSFDDDTRDAATAKKEGDMRVAEFCSTRLLHFVRYGIPLARSVTEEDLVATQRSIFEPHVFMQSLEVVMARQRMAFPRTSVPILLIFLTKALLSAGALTTRAIFRVAGDPEKVQRLRARINRGEYNIVGLFEDLTTVSATRKSRRHTGRMQTKEQKALVATLASTFKVWLYELREPLFPVSMYSACLAASQNGVHISEICLKLPKLNMRVVLFVVAFLQLFCEKRVIEQTGLDVSDLALIFTPAFLRDPSGSLDVTGNHLPFERLFVETMLHHLPVRSLDHSFRPSFEDVLLDSETI